MSEQIPEAWEVIPISSLGQFFGGLTGKSSKDFGEGQPFLTYLQVFSQTVSDKSSVNFVKIENDERQHQVKFGDVLFTTSSETPDEVGMTAVFLEDNWSPYLNSFCFGLRPSLPSSLDPFFAKFLFRGRKFRKDISPLAQGSTRFNLSKENLRRLALLMPPLLEQKKIASILTSVDEVIENTQKQINKLRGLKQATMDELLTKGIGHTEFKGKQQFPEGWQVIPLASLGQFFGGLTGKSSKDFGEGQPFLTYMQVFSQTVSDKSSVNFVKIGDDEKQHQVRFGDVLFTTSSETPDEVGMTAVFLEESWSPYLNSFCFGLRPSLPSPLDPFFAQFLFRGTQFRRDIRSLAQGSTRFNLSRQNLKKLSLLVPSLPEQKKIASILTSADEAIENIQKRINKLYSLKKSLMQDLLTGKVRVQAI